MFAAIKRNLLKSVMLADGAVSLVAGAGLVALASPVASLLGPAATPASVTAVGLFLLGWGAFHLATGWAPQPRANAVRIAILGDAAWVAASGAVLFVGGQHLSALGMVIIAVVAVAVLDIMFLKMAGRRRQVLAT